ncbi:Uncharacterized protein dnm_072540 [Desulfonema magnum]|uniref:Uncharacterized protein n=1 Tax=Desulfonema magnum TaxID=45655 RepID=A0A975BSX0_9BACT|nr:Uncharacterized protein dnm_072540 [Desulfonema magnum]
MIKFFCHSCESRNPPPPDSRKRQKTDSVERNDKLFGQTASKNLYIEFKKFARLAEEIRKHGEKIA